MRKKNKAASQTLTDTDIETRRGIGRRAFLMGTLGGTAALAGCVETVGLTDSDTGRYADPAGGGRGLPRGITDSDTGRYADPAGRGIGRITDSDTGRYADPAGQGRGRRRRITDADVGRYADPAGRGRG